MEKLFHYLNQGPHHYVLVLIVFFALVGLLCALYSLYRIHAEGKFLRENGQGDDRSDSYWQNWLAPMKGSGKHKRFFLARRIDVLVNAKKASDGGAQPQLHDLHELTLQEEQSHFAPAAVNTIISFLLILGILGTLTGVGSVVEKGQGSELLSRMAGALEPSMLAVLFTVLLMWIRGLYAARMDALMEELDLFTMTDLLPSRSLRPVSSTQQQAGQLEVITSNVQSFSSYAKGIKESAETIKNDVEGLKTALGGLKQQSEKLQEVVEKMNQLERDIDEDEMQLNRECAAHLEELPAALKETHGAVENLSAKVQGLRQRTQETGAEFAKIPALVEQAGKQLADGLELICNLALHAPQFHRNAEVIHRYEDNLKHLAEAMKGINAVYAAMEADMAGLKHNSEEAVKVHIGIYESTQIMGTALDDLRKEMETNQYETHLENAISDAEKARQELAAACESLVERGENLVHEFNRRANRISSDYS